MLSSLSIMATFNTVPVFFLIDLSIESEENLVAMLSLSIFSISVFVSI